MSGHENKRAHEDNMMHLYEYDDNFSSFIDVSSFFPYRQSKRKVSGLIYEIILKYNSSESSPSDMNMNNFCVEYITN